MRKKKASRKFGKYRNTAIRDTNARNNARKMVQYPNTANPNVLLQEGPTFSHNFGVGDLGAANVNFRKISVRKTIWGLEFSDHLL